MTNPAPGRHRASAPAGRRGSTTSVLAVALIAAVVAGVVVLFATGSPETSPLPDATDTATPTETSSGTGAVETTRTTSLDGGGVVTVEEVSRVVSDAGVVAEPSPAAPTGLRLIGLRVTGQDGRSTPFSAPVEVGPSGSLSVTARYRLSDCPDVLPAVWPSPTTFPTAVQTYVRLDQPLHTASAICPRQAYRSNPSPDLRGELVPGAGVRVLVTWSGTDALTVAGIGSASGIAAIPVERAPECASDPSCVAVLDAVTAGGQNSTATLTLDPVDPCPPGTDSDRLVLRVTDGSRSPVTESLDVKGLHRAVCGQ